MTLVAALGWIPSLGRAHRRSSARHATVMDHAVATRDSSVHATASVFREESFGAEQAVQEQQPMRVSLAGWQQDALHAIWQAQGVRSTAQRQKLVALGSAMLLFRSPHDLSRACAFRPSCVPSAPPVWCRPRTLTRAALVPQ